MWFFLISMYSLKLKCVHSTTLLSAFGKITRPMLAGKGTHVFHLGIFLLSPSFWVGYNSGPQPFWHQGPVWRKTIFPRTGWGMVSGWFKYIHLFSTFLCTRSSLVAQMVKNLPAMWEIWVQSLGWKEPLEKEMATHSSIIAWSIPCTEEPGRLQSMGLQRVRHKLNDFHLFLLLLYQLHLRSSGIRPQWLGTPGLQNRVNKRWESNHQILLIFSFCAFASQLTPSSSREYLKCSQQLSVCVCVCVCACVLVIQSCLTLCDPTDYILPGSSVHGILQARMLEWDAISFSKPTAIMLKKNKRCWRQLHCKSWEGSTIILWGECHHGLLKIVCPTSCLFPCTFLFSSIC